MTKNKEKEAGNGPIKKSQNRLPGIKQVKFKRL